MLLSKSPLLHNVVIITWHGKAYLPTQAQYESGIFVHVKPVYIVEITVEELVRAIQAVKDAGHMRLPDPITRDEFLALGDPVLAATGAKSWKQLAKEGMSYSITWTSEQLRIDTSYVDNKGRWQNDPGRIRVLPFSIPLEQVAEIILEDLNYRPVTF